MDGTSKASTSPVHQAMILASKASVSINLGTHATFGEKLEGLKKTIRPFDNNLIFYHIPRTAGSAWVRMLDEWYSRGSLLDTFPVQEAEVYDRLAEFVKQVRTISQKCIHVHAPYPVDQAVSGNWKYLTLMREPVDRVISQYNIAREMTASGAYSFLGQAAGSLKEYVDAYPHHTSNLQTRFIMNLNKFGTDVRESCERPITDDPDEVVATCMGILREKFAFIGITEMWSATMLSFCLACGRTDVPLMNDFMRSNTPYQPSSADREYVAVRNQLDVALYEQVKQQFLRDRQPIIEFLAQFGIPTFHAKNEYHECFQLCREGSGV